MTTEGREATPACEWCGRALRQVDGAWWAVKGEERGYHPPYCDAADDSRHSPASAGREATVWLDTGGLALAVRLRLAWAVLRRRPVEMQKRHPASDTVFPL